MARRGETVELAPREIRIDELELVRRPDPDHAEFRMTCGKGAYVRAIARDLGEALGCHAHVAALRRTAVGAFQTRATPSRSMHWRGSSRTIRCRRFWFR